jgi:hypothetical protein
VEDAEARHRRAQVRVQRVGGGLALVRHLEGVVLQGDVLVQRLAQAALGVLAGLVGWLAMRTRERRNDAEEDGRWWGRKRGQVQCDYEQFLSRVLFQQQIYVCISKQNY